METSTLFAYRCRCGANEPLTRNGASLRCGVCSREYPVTPSGIIDLLSQKTEQSTYFDDLYGRGQMHQAAENSGRTWTYESTADRARLYLARCGCDLSKGVENASILDVACGSGWVTAGLIVHPNVRNCTFQAFDVSIGGLELLSRFLQQAAIGTNRVEMSVQNAQEMCFVDASFDFVIGSSVLHHFTDPAGFLRDCRRVLKPGGIATFGEPFAIGYGLGAAALMIAQSRQRKKHKSVEHLYNHLSARMKATPGQMEKLLDKHLFLHSTFLEMAYAAGFRKVEFISHAPREYFRERFIDDLAREYGIQDARLCKEATAIYRVIFDLFDSDAHRPALASFVYLVLRA